MSRKGKPGRAARARQAEAARQQQAAAARAPLTTSPSPKNVTAARIIIDFRGYWLSGTGGSGAGDADVFAYRDQHGCPAMPMTQVKGILREAASRVLDDADVNALFGCGDSAGEQQGALRFAGDARMADAAWYAENPELRAALFTILRSTALEHGVAKRDMLRGVEVALPMTLSATVQSNGAPDSWFDKLRQICAATISLGKESHRGLGLAVVTCEAIDATEGVTPITAPSDHRLWLDLTCDHPAIFSQSGATEGQHKSLPGPTGAALWGWAIHQCKDDELLLDALLAGRIVFSDAVPLAGGTPVYPRPANLFAPKHEQGSQTWWVGRAAYEAAHDGRQGEAMGPCHLSADLSTRWATDRQHRLRTAMKDGKAAHSQLFSTEYVRAAPDGYRIEIDASAAKLEPNQWARLCQAFSRPLHLGKSRHAGFGGEYRPAFAKSAPYPEETVTVENSVMIRALSDLAIPNTWGQLALPPSPETFGFAGWRFDPAASAISTRRFAPWNRKLGRRSGEWCVIEAGSVIAFAGADSKTLKPAPVGIGLERGFGRWMVMPSGSVSPQDAKTARSMQSRIIAPVNALHNVAKRTATERDTRPRDTWIAGLKDQSGRFRRGPSRSQWGHVEAALRNSADGTDILSMLDAYLKRNEQQDDAGWKSMRGWLEEQIGLMNAWPASHRRFALARMLREARLQAPRARKDG